MSFSPFDAGLFAEARSLVDWNTRNKFCPACGSPTYSLWAGWKLACMSLLQPNAETKESCPSGKGIQNYAYPRTDPVVIVAVVSRDRAKILLGRNKKFPASFYSCLAGFLEPGESIEEAVKREVFEESGITVTDVQYHSTQPWPYPANLMLGCYAIAEKESIQRIDDELEDARFFSKSEIREILAHPQGAVIRPPQAAEDKLVEMGHVPLAPGADGKRNEPRNESSAAKIRVPPVSAIAGVLISEWAFDRVSLKSNL